MKCYWLARYFSISTNSFSTHSSANTIYTNYEVNASLNSVNLRTGHTKSLLNGFSTITFDTSIDLSHAVRDQYADHHHQ